MSSCVLYGKAGTKKGEAKSAWTKTVADELAKCARPVSVKHLIYGIDYVPILLL